jgi:hypothetical protein
MGDPNTFAEFLGYCNRNYPAEKQFVIIWNHGGGSLGGVAFDRNFDDDSLSLPELRDAFVAAPAISGAYEIVGFDACLMATIDMAGVLNGRTHYLLAAEESEPTCGWNYTGLFGALVQNPTQDGAELGRAVCDSFYSGCADYGVEDEATLSVVDLSRADRLLAAYNSIGDEALVNGAAQGEAYFSALSAAALDSEIYGNGNFDMVDLGDLAEQAKNIAGAYLDVQYCAYYDGRPSYAFDLGTSRAVDVSRLSEGVIADNFGGKWTVARNAGYDAYTEIYLEVVGRKPGEYTIYACPVMLNNEQNTAAGTEAVLMASYDEKTKQYSILGVRSTDTGANIIANEASGDNGANGGSGNGGGSNNSNAISNGAGTVISNSNSIITNGKMRMASKDLRPLAEGDILQPIWRWANADENGAVPALEWDKSGTDEFDYRFMLDASVELYDTAFLDGYYRVSFVMVDYAGQRYVSDGGWYQYDEGTDTVKAVAATGMPTIR